MQAVSFLRDRMGTVFVLYCGAVILLLLWPYQFSGRCHVCSNGASWTKQDGSLAFRKPGIVLSPVPPRGLHDALVAKTPALSIEVWLTTANAEQTGPARIVSYSKDTKLRNFTLGQVRDGLAFRLRTTGTNLNATSKQIVVPNVFEPGQRQHIMVSYASARCQIYVTGRLHADLACPDGDFANWDPSYRLAIGNEVTGNRAWLGRIEAIAVFDRAMPMAEVTERSRHKGLMPDGNPDGAVARYVFTGGGGPAIRNLGSARPGTDLELPRTYADHDVKGMLSLEKRELWDYLENLAIFIPFGWLAYLVMRRSINRTVIAAIASVAVVVVTSAGMEALQFYVVGRTSALLDLGSSLAGGVAGILAASAFKHDR